MSTTATTTIDNSTIADTTVTEIATSARTRFVRAGLLAGAVAAAVTSAIAAAGDAADVSLEVPAGGGKSIPVYAFAQVTLFATVIGLGLAAVLRRRSAHPGVLFTRITTALTALSLVPPFLVDANTSTRLLLVVTHVVAAAIVIPVVAKRLAR